MKRLTTEENQSLVKSNLLKFIGSELFIVKSVTWEDMVCGDTDDMTITIDCKIIKDPWSETIKKALKKKK